MTEVHDLALGLTVRPLALAAHEQARHSLDGLLGGAQPHAHGPRTANVV